MKQSNTLLWALVILFVGVVTWLAVTGRLEAIANVFVDAYLNFVANIARTLRR